MNSVKKYDFMTPDECDKVVEIILSMEDFIKELGPDLYAGTNNDSLTGRYHCFNFLNIKIINSIVAPKLKEIFGPCTVQCWANIFRHGEGIELHKHITDIKECPQFVAAGNIFLDGDPNIGTYYDGIKDVNKVGELSLFSPDIPHYVPKNPTNNIRISMALDVYVGSEDFMKTMATREPYRYVFIE
jgi:hypothetical protein